jgi:hypothetical protein
MLRRLTVRAELAVLELPPGASAMAPIPLLHRDCRARAPSSQRWHGRSPGR